MGSRSRWMVSGIVLAAAVAGFLALRAGPNAPASGGRASLPTPVSSRGTQLPPDHGAKTEPPGAPDGEPDGGEDDPGEARHLAEQMAKLVRDLEYTPGLPEPTQQTVQQQPEPWRPDPIREGPAPSVDDVTPLRIRITGGDRVTIRGQNLRVVQVMFGAIPGKLLGASGTQVVVEAPASAAGPVTIAVTNDDGTWALAGTPVLYVE